MLTEEELQQLLNDIAQATFEEAQRLAPDNTGALKQSGKVSITPDGFEIIYTAPYVDTIVKGQTDPNAGIYVMKVPSHTRRTRTGITRVKAHTKTFQPGYKPARRPDGSWYTGRTSDTIRPNSWVQQAWTRVRKRIDSQVAMYLPKTLDFETI